MRLSVPEMYRSYRTSRIVLMLDRCLAVWGGERRGEWDAAGRAFWGVGMRALLKLRRQYARPRTRQITKFNDRD